MLVTAEDRLSRPSNPQPPSGGLKSEDRMAEKVAIIGVGYEGFTESTPHISVREMMFRAAQRAYAEAGVDPREDVDAFICATEDFWEGWSISDEMVPDQIGAALRPLHTVAGDGLHALANAFMMIRTGRFQMVAVEAHSKHSDVVNPDEILRFGLEPILLRPVVEHPLALAALEMRRYMVESKTSESQTALVVVKNKGNARSNPRGTYAASLKASDVLMSEKVVEPLRQHDIARPADACIVLVLASEKLAKKAPTKPVWVEGVGWSTDGRDLWDRNLALPEAARAAARGAMRVAGIDRATEIDIFEVDDTFSYKELQMIEAAGLAPRGKAGRLIESGEFSPSSHHPVNLSGGSLGVGALLEANGLHRVLEATLTLRGATSWARPDFKRALALSWRGVPTATYAAAILST
jgi:acetyl-CoA C-acetyltransferase